MTEKEWQSRIVDLAKIMGWRVYSTRAAQTAKGWRTPVTSKGFPDLLLLKSGRLIAAELKVGTAVRSEQAEWLHELSLVAGVEAYVWRPEDWDSVVDVLRAKREARSAEPRASMVGAVATPLGVALATPLGVALATPISHALATSIRRS